MTLRREYTKGMSENHTGKIVWLLTGAAIGATIALLYAPSSGEDTRRFLTKKVRKGKRALAEASEDIVEKGRDYYERGRRLADDAAEMFDRGRRLVER